MLTRPVEAWVEIFEKLGAQNSSVEEAIAQRILSDLVGYRPGAKSRLEDAKNLATALEAYLKLLQKHGIKL